jgi:hypothetical protein
MAEFDGDTVEALASIIGNRMDSEHLCETRDPAAKFQKFIGGRNGHINFNQMSRLEYFGGSFEINTAWANIYGAASVEDFGRRIDTVTGQMEF